MTLSFRQPLLFDLFLANSYSEVVTVRRSLELVVSDPNLNLNGLFATCVMKAHSKFECTAAEWKMNIEQLRTFSMNIVAL